MDKAILDTDILSEYFKGHHATVAARSAAYAKQHRVLSFTSVTVYEILFGLELKGAASQRGKALAWIEQNEEITPAAADYRLAATIKATAKMQGAVVELADCLIAATAVRMGRPLVTGNTGDFQAIQRTGVKLALDNWREEERPL